MGTLHHNSPLVSVIIPVYNTGTWLRRCLDSVCAQSLKDIQIICVDDGSTDGSAEILQDYAEKDSRVLPITLGKNQGVSVARNVGMGAANGEWLGFVDSDDTIMPDFYEKLFAAAASGNAEIVKGVCWSERLAPEYIDRSVNEDIKKNKQNFGKEWTTALYNANFIRTNNIRFIPDCIRNQDVAFAYSAATSANSIILVDDAVYNYYYRPGSANTQISTYRQISSILISYKYMIDSIEKFIDNVDIYINEYHTMIEHCTTLPHTAYPQEKNLVCRDAASAAITFFTNCRERDMLFQKINRYDTVLAVALRDNDVENLANYLALNRVDRLRYRVRRQLFPASTRP